MRVQPLLVSALSVAIAWSAEAQERRPAPPARAPAASAARGPIGSFLATRIDREPLPLQDQVVDEDGTQYLIEFDRLVLALREDNTFRASVRFRRTLYSASARARGRQAPLQTMTVTGTWAQSDSTIRFTPDDNPETRGLRMLAGTVRSARELSVPFHYRNGQRERDRVLVMTKRDDIL